MKHISILGGGMAGLAVGYYARKTQFPFMIYEANEWEGGNCATFRHREFLFDLGAHRFHDRIEAITEDLRELLGQQLQKITVPSVIFHKGRLIRFPLSPMDLFKKLGPVVCTRVAQEVIRSRLARTNTYKTFADYATGAYGRTVADAFLLNYTEKLYGKSCSQLSPAVGGERLKGLNLRTFLLEAVSRSNLGTSHMEGAFYYPRSGIGAIAENLASFCGSENIRTGAKVTRVFHGGGRIQKIEINGKDLVEIDEAVSTLPLDHFLHSMDPPPPPSVLNAVDKLKFRSLVLVALFLNKPSVTPYATIYFPEARFAHTRTYEPRNRSSAMSPRGKTCLVSEIPCQRRDALWSLDDESLIRMTASNIMQTKWITEESIIDAKIVRLNYAYPVLELGFEKRLSIIMDYLGGFGNLKLSGRNARFVYSWIHNMLYDGKEIVKGYSR